MACWAKDCPCSRRCCKKRGLALREAGLFSQWQFTCRVQSGVSFHRRGDHHEVSVEASVIAPPKRGIENCGMGGGEFAAGGVDRKRFCAVVLVCLFSNGL